jgi:hypothetical protein
MAYCAAFLHDIILFRNFFDIFKQMKKTNTHHLIIN